MYVYIFTHRFAWAITTSWWRHRICSFLWDSIPSIIGHIVIFFIPYIIVTVSSQLAHKQMLIENRFPLKTSIIWHLVQLLWRLTDFSRLSPDFPKYFPDTENCYWTSARCSMRFLRLCASGCMGNIWQHWKIHSIELRVLCVNELSTVRTHISCFLDIQQC